MRTRNHNKIKRLTAKTQKAKILTPAKSNTWQNAKKNDLRNLEVRPERKRKQNSRSGNPGGR